MSFNGFIARIFCLMALIFFAFLVRVKPIHANEIYLLKENANERKYLTLERGDTEVRLRVFEQRKGEYQSLLKSLSFKNMDAAKVYLANKYKAQKISQLPLWPVEFSKLQEKGLFGKKHQELWKATNSWNREWEAKFSEWLEKEVDSDFYHRLGIRTDCADAVIGLRWIFARNNSLPVANTLADSGNLFGHFSMNRKWNKLPKADLWYKDELFMTALDYVMDLTSTRTLIKDGYPLAISSDALKAGAFVLTRNQTDGHVKIISKTNYLDPLELPIYTLASTSPRELRKLQLEIMVDQEWPYPGAKEVLGFRRPVLVGEDWRLLSPDKNDFYSLEQFDGNLKLQYPQFIKYVLKKTKGDFDPVFLTKYGAQDIKSYILQRVDIVTKGYEYCSKHKCPKDSTAYEEWSTPSRDSKLKKKYEDMFFLIKAFSELADGLDLIWEKELLETKVQVYDRELTLSQVQFLIESGKFSSDPNETPLRRFGLETKAELLKLSEEVKTKLASRANFIQNKGRCEKSCLPNSLEWSSKTTYSLDKELLNLYTEIESYCHLTGDKLCLKGMSGFNANLELSPGMSETFLELYLRIPYFHSEPRVSLERRWGKDLNGVRMTMLPFVEKVDVLSKGLALLDGHKLYDLKNKKILKNVGDTEQIFTTKTGRAFLWDEKTGTLYELKFDLESNSGDVLYTKVALNDPSGLLSSNRQRIVNLVETENYPLFRISLRSGQLLFKINATDLEFVEQYNGAQQIIDDFIVLSNDNQKISLVDLESKKIHEFEFVIDENFKNTDKIKFISVNKNIAFALYEDRDWALKYPLILNLKNQTIKKIDLPLEDNFNYEITFSAKNQNAFFVQTKLASEYPELMLFFYDSEKITKKLKLNQTLKDTFEDKKDTAQGLYFIEGEGNQWGEQKYRLYNLRNGNLNEITYGLYAPKELVNGFVLFESLTDGALYHLNTHKTYKVSVGLNFSLDEMKGAESTLGYTFDTSYSENYRAGGVLDIHKLESLAQEELIPEASFYSFINRESLVDSRWLTTFSTSHVARGTLLTFKRNFVMWMDFSGM